MGSGAVPNQHKTTPKAVRMPGGLLARIESAVEGSPETVNAFIVAAIEDRLERREGGSTPPPARARTGSTAQARTGPPEPAASATAPSRALHAANCKCGICKPPKNGGTR